MRIIMFLTAVTKQIFWKCPEVTFYMNIVEYTCNWRFELLYVTIATLHMARLPYLGWLASGYSISEATCMTLSMCGGLRSILTFLLYSEALLIYCHGFETIVSDCSLANGKIMITVLLCNCKASLEIEIMIRWGTLEHLCVCTCKLVHCLVEFVYYQLSADSYRYR